MFASINAVADDTERQERLEQLAYLLLPDKANDSEAGVFFCKNGRKMITAALICYYGMGWDFIKICEHFLSNDWRSLLNDMLRNRTKLQICISVLLQGHQNRIPQAASRLAMTA